MGKGKKEKKEKKRKFGENINFGEENHRFYNATRRGEENQRHGRGEIKSDSILYTPVFINTKVAKASDVQRYPLPLCRCMKRCGSERCSGVKRAKDLWLAFI